MATLHRALLRDALGYCPKDTQQLVGAAIRPIFRVSSLQEARRLLAETVTHLEGRVPKVARLLLEAEPDLLAFYAFPAAHRSKLRSTNPLERVNREIGPRTDVVCECWGRGLRRTVCQAPMLAPRHDSRCRWRVGRCLDAEPSAAGAGVGLAHHLAGLLAACPTRWS